MLIMKVLQKATLMTILSSLVSGLNEGGECSCTPLVYNWKLDFSRTCSRSNFNITTGAGTGILEASCDVSDPNIMGPSVTDFTPISVVSYQIIELDLDLIPVKVDGQSNNITLFSESTVIFSSFTAAQQNATAGGLKASMIGLNADQQRIQLNWIVKYSNLCDMIPYSLEDSLGWMIFVADEPGMLPRADTCFAEYENPSSLPSIVPSSPPSQKPTVRENTELPSVPHSRQPTPAPSAFPTAIKQPTDVLSAKGSYAPSEVPSFSMSYSFNYEDSYSYSYGSLSYSYSYDFNSRRISSTQGIYNNEFGRATTKRKRVL